MSGGGKGGSETTKTEIPDWIKQPAIRNLQRAEDVQRIEYMPYYGGDVAAFTPAQNAAFTNNIGAAEAFGLLAPNTLTATSGMPTPTDFDGFTGYSSQPMYESALAELKAKQPGAVAQYDALFGAHVPTQRNWGGGGGGRFGGSADVTPPGRQPITTSGFGPTLNLGEGPMAPAAALDQLNADRSKMIQKNPDGSFVNVLGTGDKEGQDNWNRIVAQTAIMDEMSANQGNAGEKAAQTAWASNFGTSPGHPSNQNYNYAPKKKVDKMIVDDNVEKISFIEPMTIRDLGQPPNLDVRKNANPHSTDYYTLGAVYPPKFSKGGW